MLNLAVGRVALESVGDFGVLADKRLVDHQELKDTGGVENAEIDLDAEGKNGLHQHAVIREIMQDLFGLFFAEAGALGDAADKVGLHRALEGDHNGDLIVGNPLLKGLVLGTVGRDFVVTVVDDFTHFDQVFSYCHKSNLSPLQNV